MAPSRTPTKRDTNPVVSAPTEELPLSKIPAAARPRSRTVKPTSSSTIKAGRPSTSGGVYSMTKTPPLRASTLSPVDDSITVEIAGRTVRLTRRDARALAEKLLRAIK